MNAEDVELIYWNWNNREKVEPRSDRGCRPDSCLMDCVRGTCRPVKATPSCWPTETAFSPSCCTVASSTSQAVCGMRGHTRIRGHARVHPTERRVTESDPPCCRSAWRFVGTHHRGCFSFRTGPVHRPRPRAGGRSNGRTESDKQTETETDYIHF